MRNVLILGDWDADGVVSAALIVYAQEVKRVYPLREKASILLKPCDPHRLKRTIINLDKVDIVVILDIPYVRGLERVFNRLKTEYNDIKIIYFDHHLSTVHALSKLRGIVDEVNIGYEPTTELVYNKIKNYRISLTPRLEMFSKIVSYMDKGVKVPQELLNTARLAKGISRMLTLNRDEELWVRIVKWLASPLTVLTTPGFNISDIIRKYSLTEDIEVKEKAIELALEARTVGYIKFVDARGKWMRRGASALASRIYRILRKPVALLIEDRRKNPILIIRARKGIAARIANMLMEKGVVVDIGGHANLAITRLKTSITKEKLINILREASLKI